MESKTAMKDSQRDSKTNLHVVGAGNSFADRGKDKMIEDLQIMNK